MGNTANNNWPYPESTDLVKDGATAIENLADAIDTTLGVFVPSNPGLTLINTTSFTGVASQTLPAGTFTSAYRDYRLIFKAINTNANQHSSCRLVTSGTPNSGAIYNKQHLDVYGGTASAAQYNGQTSLSDLFYSATTYPSYTILDLFSPQATDYTTALCFQNANFGTSVQFRTQVYSVNATTSFDSIQLFPNSSGNITGSVSVFGYNA
jgi:hypothetical protein